MHGNSISFPIKSNETKHLRLDIRKQTLEKERKEEERKQREQEERYCQEQEEKRRQENNDNIEEEEEEEPPIVTEYFVYICQCCQKKFNTTNQFANHTKSKRHKENAKLYEEAGIIVTEVQLRKDHEDDNDYLYGGDGVEDGERGEDDTIHGLAENDEDSSYSEEDEPSSDEEDHKMKKVGSLFCAMAAFTSDSESSSSESEMSEEENDDSGDAKDIRNVGGVASINNDSADDASEYAGSDYEDDLDLLEEIIYQNRVQKSVQNLNGNEKNEDEEGNVESATPVYFDDEQYDPDFLSASENRVAAVQYRLQKRCAIFSLCLINMELVLVFHSLTFSYWSDFLMCNRLAAKGIQPNQSINQSHLSTQAVTVGKTLLQQVMQANIDTLEARLAAYNRHKEQCQLLGREFRFARGNSKALPSQYTYRIDPSDNRRQRENVHHTGRYVIKFFYLVNCMFILYLSQEMFICFFFSDTVTTTCNNHVRCNLVARKE